MQYEESVSMWNFTGSLAAEKTDSAERSSSSITVIFSFSVSLRTPALPRISAFSDLFSMLITLHFKVSLGLTLLAKPSPFTVLKNRVGAGLGLPGRAPQLVRGQAVNPAKDVAGVVAAVVLASPLSERVRDGLLLRVQKHARLLAVALAGLHAPLALPDAFFIENH